MVLAILGLVSPIVKLLINLFIRNEAKKAAYLKAWEEKKKSIIASLGRSMDMKTSYDTAAAEQDARLASKEEPKP